MREYVVCVPSKNIAARMDGKVCPPEGAARIACRTKYAARVAAIRPTTKFITKLDTSDCNEPSHEVSIPPAGNGVATPNELNHPTRGTSVANTTTQNIHFVKPPPMRNVVPPSR